jgi:triosephosphate isomerase (TIM)
VSRIPMIAGNWKMNLNRDESVRLVKAIAGAIGTIEKTEVLVAPPFTALSVVKEAIGRAGILLGAQNAHWELEGAYTGEISPAMIREAGCTHVILGHSERRSIFTETDAMIDKKSKAAVDTGLIPIICIGETLEQREAGKTTDTIQGQLDGSLNHFRENKAMPAATVLAYEPVWAIGTGKTATPGQAQEVHRFIRDWLSLHFGQALSASIRILYGGSVKQDNIKELMAMPDIDGALVGGASLKADSFTRIIRFRD